MILIQRFPGGRVRKNDNFGKFRFCGRLFGNIFRRKRFSGGRFRQGRRRGRILLSGGRGCPAGQKNGGDQGYGKRQLHGTCSIISSTTALIISS
jgi:hypothetical protein